MSPASNITLCNYSINSQQRKLQETAIAHTHNLTFIYPAQEETMREGQLGYRKTLVAAHNKNKHTGNYKLTIRMRLTIKI